MFSSPFQRPPACQIPVIASDWKVLFRPQKTGTYINDHTVIRGRDGKWHLFGITCPGKADPEQERYFAHGSGPALWSDTPLEEHSPVCNDGTRAWAPGAIAHGNRYFMIYGPSPSKLVVSRDLGHWMGAPVSLIGAPAEACHRDHMIFHLEASTWLMYATGLDEAGLGVISVFVSNDLLNWRYIRPALRTEGKSALSASWGATESPFVFFYKGWYYLSITYTDCSLETYQNTLLFASLNPFDFGVLNADRPDESVIARLKAHAPEYLYDADSDTWYVNTCGWPNQNIPHEGAASIARLEWRDSIPYRA